MFIAMAIVIPIEDRRGPHKLVEIQQQNADWREAQSLWLVGKRPRRESLWWDLGVGPRATALGAFFLSNRCLFFVFLLLLIAVIKIIVPAASWSLIRNATNLESFVFHSCFSFLIFISSLSHYLLKSKSIVSLLIVLLLKELIIMGRIRGYRDKLRTELHSVRQKTLECTLVFHTERDFSVCKAEAHVVVYRALEFLGSQSDSHGIRAANQVVIPLPSRAEETRKNCPNIEYKNVAITPILSDDIDVWLEFGASTMQIARILRMVEESDSAASTMPLKDLARLISLSRQAIGEHLRCFWQQEFRLPIQGSRASFQGMKSRVGEVLYHHLTDTVNAILRKSLALSPLGWERCLWQARSVVNALLDGEEMVSNISNSEIDSIKNILRNIESRKDARKRLDALLDKIDRQRDHVSATPRHHFEAILIKEHNFSLSKAGLYATMVEEKAAVSLCHNNTNQIVYYALAADEPGGKELSACRRVAVSLSYITPDDYDLAGRSRDLKCKKLQRFTTETKAQGGLLTLPDLAFLLGIAPQTVSRLIQSFKVYLPTRGRECDLGPSISHKSKIVTLYIEGFTETEVAKRTQHSLDAVSNYIHDFQAIMILVDQGLPTAHIRKVTKHSRRLVDEYIKLYRRLNIEENQWKLNLMRQSFSKQEKKALRLEEE